MADPYLTVDDLTARGVDIGGENPEMIERLVTRFERIVERARGVAYVPRDHTVSFGAARYGCRSVVDLPHRMVRSASYVVGGGAPVAVVLDDRAKRLGRLYAMPSSALLITYEHGLDAPPPGILDACATFVTRSLNVARSGVSRDVLSQAIDGGTTRYATPDWPAGRYTGFLDVDAAINAEPDYRVVIG